VGGWLEGGSGVPRFNSRPRHAPRSRHGPRGGGRTAGARRGEADGRPRCWLGGRELTVAGC
jgi:hypothetical protein